MERSTDKPGVMPLSHVPPGTEATVARLSGGGTFQNRLLSMGLNIGCRVRVLRGSNGAGGPVLVALGQTRLAIGRGMADRILVSPVPPP